MVKLSEWRGKEIFRRYGVPIPRGVRTASAEDAAAAVREARVPFPVVVKAQVLAGGRGKGGAVKFATDESELRGVVGSILGREFQGEVVREVLIEERLRIDRELYLSVSLDRGVRLPVVLASAHGGIEIESVPDAELLRQPVHPMAGVPTYAKRRVARALGLTGDPARSVGALLETLWRVFDREDAELVEVNPLALTPAGFVALDAKVIIEDDAAFRHPEYSDIRDDRTPLEELAREKEIAFVQLEGNIGVIANGAGLTMATLDVLQASGGSPGVFLDLGGTDDPHKVTEAFLLMAKAKPAAVFLNIFGGVTRCDTVARGLVDAMQDVPKDDRFPLVARIRGNNEAEGVAILREAGVTSLPDLRQAVRAVVDAAAPARSPAARP